MLFQFRYIIDQLFGLSLVCLIANVLLNTGQSQRKERRKFVSVSGAPADDQTDGRRGGGIITMESGQSKICIINLGKHKKWLKDTLFLKILPISWNDCFGFLLYLMAKRYLLF